MRVGFQMYAPVALPQERISNFLLKTLVLVGSRLNLNILVKRKICLPVGKLTQNTYIPLKKI